MPGVSLWLLMVVLSPLALTAQQDVVGAVYTMSNDPSGNAVLVFNRGADGRLTFSGAFSTRGLGTGGRKPDLGLANAGTVALSDDNRLLFVVNPGSDDVSVFAVKKKGLELVDREGSGGKEPVSVT